MPIVPTDTFTTAKASTCVMPKYHPTGQRDAFVSLDRAAFSSVKRGGVSLKKIANAKPPTVMKFMPSGNGRDMFQQLGHDPIMTHAGVTKFSDQAPRRFSVPHGVAKLHVPVPRYIPTGTGRDVMNIGGDFKGTYTAVYTSSFRLGRKKGNPRARTDPPPRYQASGTGRDTFHNCDDRSMAASPSRGLLYGSDQLASERPRTIQDKLLLSKEFCVHQTHSMQRLASPARLPSPEMKQLRLSTAPSAVPRPAPMFIKL